MGVDFSSKIISRFFLINSTFTDFQTGHQKVPKCDLTNNMAVIQLSPAQNGKWMKFFA